MGAANGEQANSNMINVSQPIMMVQETCLHALTMVNYDRSG
jgi:hypothetical protein